MTSPLTIAVPKGRVLSVLGPLFEKAGIDTAPLKVDDRTLIRTTADGSLRFLLLKPDDVPTYVEYGAAQLGVCGLDVLLEHQHDFYQPLDLNLGRCKLVVAAPVGVDRLPDFPRIATKFVRSAAKHFREKGMQAETIYVGGSVELAPLVGLADAIVDLVETGSTLRENHLHILDDVCEISSVMIANRAAYKLRSQQIMPLLKRLRQAVEEA